MSEGNGSGLVVPIMAVYDLRAKLDKALGELADSVRRCKALEAELEQARAEVVNTLRHVGGPVAEAHLQRIRLRAELRDLRPG